MSEIQTETSIEELLKESLGDSHEIVLFNDDVNTFDHVIDCLVKYCEHSPMQAEQCSYIVHYNGKCSVKRGALQKLKPINQALIDQKLSAKII
jgi:ATP-dependent Clp protease adaptor protein ClpS